MAQVKTTVLYIGFTGGTEADIGNMVLYTTKRGNSKITAATPVKLKGASNPIISLTNKGLSFTTPEHQQSLRRSAGSDNAHAVDPVGLLLRDVPLHQHKQ